MTAYHHNLAAQVFRKKLDMAAVRTGASSLLSWRKTFSGLVLALVFGVLVFVATVGMASASTYGSGTYDSCTYNCVAAANSTSGNSGSSATAPNTGLQKKPVWPYILATVIGASTLLILLTKRHIPKN
jgi:hypothetical protein